LEEAAAGFIRECGIQHLLIDLPSVDKERDEANSTQSLWNVTDVNQLNADARLNATITEMIFCCGYNYRRLVIESSNRFF
jgi:hypothetical protein